MLPNNLEKILISKPDVLEKWKSISDLDEMNEYAGLPSPNKKKLAKNI